MSEIANDRRPLLYAVVFDMDEAAYRDEPPIVIRDVNDLTDETVGATRPHGLSREVANALPGLWYCLHLPNDRAQLDDISIWSIKESQGLFLGPHVLLVPTRLFARELFEAYVRRYQPVLAVCEDGLVDTVRTEATSLGFALPAAAFSELTNIRLQEHWTELARLLVPDGLLRRPPILARDRHVAPSDLVRRLIVRQLGDQDRLVTEAADRASSVSAALDVQITLAAFATLEEEGVGLKEAEARLPEQLRIEGRRLDVPLSLGVPGVPRAYERRTYERRAQRHARSVDDVAAEEAQVRDDAAAELDAIEFITAHEAVATTGVGLMLPEVPAQAWTVLADLERHFRSLAPKPRVVASMLKRLTGTMEHLFTDEFLYAVTHASTIAVNGNFPIGLLTLPGDSGPLLERAAISYRPTLPLTRALQTQLSFHTPVLAGPSLKVLVLECIPDADPVGRLSRIGWNSAKEEFEAAFDFLTVITLVVATEDDIRAALAEHQPHVLVLSAHGVFRGGDFAGIQVGNYPSLGIGLGPLPPLVVLSACHVAPRATGAVAIGDMLIREGAEAVLGTQVPVNVAHNAMLMMRFFLYIALSMTGAESFANVLDVWQHVQASNAINDLLHGSGHLAEFGRTRTPSGTAVLEEFMNTRSVGRLRKGHLHEDTEAVLVEIAKELNLDAQVANWLTSPGYLPESFFYAFVGRPELIRFASAPSPTPQQRT